MEVMGPTDVVMHATNGTAIGNGCCGDNPFFLDVDRFEVHTGNISHWSSLKRRSTQNPATELQESLIKSLQFAEKQKCCVKVPYQGKQKIVCKNSASIESVTEAERPLMKVTGKVFAHDMDHHQLKEAVLEILGKAPDRKEMELSRGGDLFEHVCLRFRGRLVVGIQEGGGHSIALSELGINSFDVVFLAFPAIPEDSTLTFAEVAKPFWREMEKLHEDNIVSHLAVCDLDAGKLKELLSWAKIKPEVNQVNLTSCCHMPQNLVEFAKQEDILLHTHGDPPTLFPDENVERVLGTYAEEEVKGWSTRWVVRYSVVVKCRGVIKNKGYIASIAQTQDGHQANGNGFYH